MSNCTAVRMRMLKQNFFSEHKHEHIHYRLCSCSWPVLLPGFAGCFCFAHATAQQLCLPSPSKSNTHVSRDRGQVPARSSGKCIHPIHAEGSSTLVILYLDVSACTHRYANMSTHRTPTLRLLYSCMYNYTCVQNTRKQTLRDGAAGRGLGKKNRLE